MAAMLAPWLALWLLADPVVGQDPALTAAPAETASPEWALSSSVYYSHPPGSQDRLTAIVYADRGPLHLETRYNYEDLETLAVFAGWTVSLEGELSASVTPMLGAVGGRTDGIAPGLELDLGWKRLRWYAEMEYLFDADDGDDDFFYSWSTLTYEIAEGLRAGLVVERSRLADTGLSLQRGLALEFQRASFGVALYAYNLGSDDEYGVVSLGYSP